MIWVLEKGHSHGKNNEKKYLHLTYKEISVIHEFLNYGYTFTAIGNRINKDRTTVAKEVKSHHFINPFGKSIEIDCHTLNKAPYVCNACPDIGKCRKAKFIYDAAIEDHEYRQNISLQRANFKVIKDQIAAINDVIAHLMIHKHHSVNHVFASHSELLPFSKSTFYRYVDLGLLDVKNIDLQRKVRFRVKKEYDYSRKKIDHKYRLGRQYHDFQDYMELHPMASIVAMDTVIGTSGGKGGKSSLPYCLELLILCLFTYFLIKKISMLTKYSKI